MKALFLTDRALADSLQPVLEEEGVQIDATQRFVRADFKVKTEAYDAVLIDRDRLGSLGYEELLRWRRDGLKAHVLVLLPPDADSFDRIDALDAGADAYLLRPLCVEELRAILRALRRRDRAGARPVLRAHDLEIDISTRRVHRGGRDIQLTPREFDLLRLLAQHQGRVLSRTSIREQLYDNEKNGHSNVVDVYIGYLRKIDKGFETPLILTSWSQGYLLRAQGA